MGDFDDLIPERKSRNPGKRERATEFDDLVPVAGAPRDNLASASDYQPLPDLMPEYDDNGNVLRATPFAPLGGRQSERLSLDAQNELNDLIGIDRVPEGGNTYLEAALKNIPRLGELGAQALRSITLIPEAALNTAERFGVPADNLGLRIQRRLIDAIGTPADEMNKVLRGLDSIGYGQGKAQIKDAKEALNPWANDNRAKAADGFGAPGNYDPLTISERLGVLGDFVGHGTLNSVADMTGAVLAPAPYVAAYTDQTARERAANDGRPLGFSDITIGAGNALVQTVAEKFATERLLPGGVKPVMDGAAAALGRVARETGVQGGTEYVQEALDYLSTHLGTEKGATLVETNDSGLSGLLIGSPLGAGGQGAKEIIRAASGPAVVTPQAPNAAPRETPQAVDITGGTLATPADIQNDAAIVEAFHNRPLGVPAEPVDEIDALLARNFAPDDAAPDVTAIIEALPPEVLQVLGAPQDTDAKWRRPDSAAPSNAPPPSAPPAVPQNPIGDAIEQANPLEAGRMAGDVLPEPGAAAAPVPGDVAGTQAPAVASRYSPLDLRQEIGWSQRGGEMVRAAPEPESLNEEQRTGLVAAPKGEVIGRTRWTGWPTPTGEESVFWKNRPDANLSEKAAQAAMDKFERGEPLKPIEQRFIDHAAATAQEYEGAMQLLEDAERGYSEVDHQNALADLREQHDIDVAEADTSEAFSLYELAHQAAASGADEIDVAQASNESGPAYAARLWKLIKEPTRGTDPRAAAEDRPSGGEGRESRPQGVEQGFALGSTAAQAEARAEVSSPGLFAAPTAREQIAAASKDRDASRNGLGRDLVRPEQGDGELLAGEKPAQTSLERTESRPESRSQPKPVPEGGSEREAMSVLAREESIAGGIEDADTNKLRDAVRAAVGGAPVSVRYLRGMAGLSSIAKPGYVRALESRQAERGGDIRTSGLYLRAEDAIDGKPVMVLFTNVKGDAAGAAFVAAHEIAGHHGLRSLLGDSLDKVLGLAEQNPTVKELADKIARGRKMPKSDRLLAVEESLAELAAANRTGDWQRIESTYGVNPSETMKSRVRAMIANIVQRIRALLGKKGLAFTDAQVQQLLANAWKAAQGQSASMSVVGANGALESVTATLGEADDASMRDLLLPVSESGSVGYETGRMVDDGISILKSPQGSTRYLYSEKGDPKAVLQIMSRDGKVGVATNVYTVEEARRRGLASKLLAAAKRDFGRIDNSDSITRDGAAWLNGQDSAIGQPQSALESTEDQTQSESAGDNLAGMGKILDKNGNPLVLYHGSPTAGIGQFKDSERGIFFTDKKALADQYTWHRSGWRSKSKTPTIYEATVSMRNPLVIDALGKRNDNIPVPWAEWKPKVFGNMPPNAVSVEAAFKYAIEHGHDGLIVKNVVDTADIQDKTKSTVYAVKSASQVELVNPPQPMESDNPSILESVEYTPEQSAALTKAGLQVDRRSSLQRVSDSLRDRWAAVRDAVRDGDNFKQSTFDKFHGLRMAEAQMGLTDPVQSPYIAARMSAGLGSNMEGLMLYGAPEWDGGVLAIKDGTVGLLDALKPVQGKVDEWLGWMVGRRAKLLKSQGRENNLSDGDIAALLSLADGNEAAFQQAARDYLTIKNAVLDVAEQAGLIDPVARAAWDHAEYVPFYRADEGGAVGPGTRKGLAGQNAGIRTLKGGEQALADPLANIVRNFSKLVDASLKNRAVLLAVDQLGPTYFKPAPREMQPATIPLDQVKKHLREQGVSDATIAGMPPAALKGVQRMLSIVPPTGEDVVRVMRAGKAEYFEVLDPLVLRALTAFKQANKSLAIKPFIWFKRLLTTGVTTTAEFVGANFIRDSGSAWVISDDRFIPGWDSLKGVGNTLRNDAGTREMMMAGSTFLGGNFYDGDADQAAAALRRALRAKGVSSKDIEGMIGTVARTPLQLWDAWLKLSGAVENANRRAVYDAALKAGRTKTEAAYMARDLMDFAMQGDAQWVQFFADVLPFFNARLQGMYKLGRRAGTPKGRKAIILRAGVMTLASVALYAWNVMVHGDGWDELEEWDKDAYWHIAPGTEYHVRIPKPFELGLVFATAPERGLEAVRNATSGEGDTPSATWDALVRAITGTLAINPIPQAALPIAEQWANKRFFTGRPIENMGDENLLPEARGEWYTSDTMKALGRMSGLSPKRLEHLWNGYTAGLGGYVLDSSDAVVRGLTDAPERPDLRLGEMPIVGRFLRGGPGRSKYSTQFYERLREAEQIEQTVKEFTVSGKLDEAKALEAENAELLGPRILSKRAKAGFLFANVKAMRKTQSALTKLREEMEDVALSRILSGEAKRERLDALETQRNKVVREAVKP